MLFSPNCRLPTWRATLMKASLLGAVTWLAACSTTAPKPAPLAGLPTAFKESQVWAHGKGSSSPLVSTAWWQLFQDPTLSSLEEQLHQGNLGIQTQLAQVRLAQATLLGYEAALWPTLGLNASSTRSGTPASGNSKRSVSTSDSLTLNASWELDLWQRASRADDAANVSLQASKDDLAAARLSAEATLAQTYFSIRATEAQQALLTRTVSANQRSLDLTQARYDSGVAARSDVLQAQTQLSSVKAQLLEAKAQQAQLEHALAVLLGQAPSALSWGASGVLPKLPAVPEVLPSTLLEHRPDIAAAERRVTAAYLQIGVAEAAFFPTVPLSASAGYRHSSLSQLISAPNLIWSIGPGLAATLVDGGARQAATDQARANADLAAASYRQTVLTSLQEVEDNLALLAQLSAEAKEQSQALEAAQQNLVIAQQQYKAGTVSYLNVVAAQTSALSAESGLLSVQSRELTAASILLKNLGGRWDEPTPTQMAGNKP